MLSDVCNKLHLMKEFLRSSYGPTARLKQVHNNIGGSVVTSSTSSVLLQAVASSQPIISLIRSSILNHVSRFSDCGLFAAVFCLCLLEQAGQCGLRKNVMIKVNKHLLALCTGYLQQEDCGCKVKLDFCSSQSLITLARSVISSKPTCVLTEPESGHISRLAVQAFLLTVPCNIPDTVRLGRTVTITIEGHSVLKSAVFPGLLLSMPENLCFDSLCSPLHVVLFSISLAGDLGEIGDGRIEMHQGVDVDSQILDQLLELGKQVLKDGVKLFLCQKVIHPVLQHYLRCNGVIVIERLGSKNEVSESTSVLGCSQTEYLLAAEAFCHSLELVATSLEHDGGTSLIDLTHAHHWTLPSDVTEEHLEGVMAPCGCGVVESCQNKTQSYLDTKYAGFSPAPLLTAAPLQATVLDSFTAKVNALGVAVETANLVLDVRYVIQDVN
ncbi:hypothetical protein GOODEAATRI_009233 [Goodea atripinnis]|uniref:McKusick-Kaufman syndrome n=1 Tax=Goodea atripinnis TaxID=208336 RepID=A0ABV0N985_9TELE